ncbi:MAG TPA: VanZ family protein [Casimicrobiaceae bacterium]|jgi:VanZ family protein|nr:VanZ family protein [Casimicrobiaceae bacterium]
MIVYASLEPFAGWMAPLPDTPFFLFEPWPLHFTRFDIVVNVLAYVPFGFLLALIGARRRSGVRLAAAVGAGAILSFAMESTQMFLPTRDASNVDVLSNSVGAAAGALAAFVFNRTPGLRSRIARWRYRTFLGGRSGDLGLALLGVWLLSQVNPAIPLFAATFDPSLELARDLAGTLLQAAQSAFNVIGVGLFLALLLRQRRHLGAAVLSLIGIALLLKGAAALLLLKSASWAFWLEPGIALGVAAGALVLMLAIWLPRPARTTLCAIALLSSLVAPLLAPDMWRVRVPLALFDWPYGQLLNFNRLTHAVLVIWPVLASAYLLWLAGQPGWGQRGSQSDADDRV